MTAVPSAEAVSRFNAARDAYTAERSLEACRLLAPILQAEPLFADAHHLTGLCLIDLGDFDGAEAALKAAAALDRRNPAIHAALGDLLRRPTRFEEAEQCYRAALGLDRRHRAAVVGLARLLMVLGRHGEVLQLTTPLAVGADVSASVLEVHAEALKHLGRMEEALEQNRRAVAAGGVGARLEEPSVLRELGRYEEAEAAARRAFDTLGDAPGAFIVHGRTLQDLGRHGEAEAAYREAITRAPLDDLAHEHLAGALLGQTGDQALALAALDAALAQGRTPGLIALKGRLLVRMNRREEAYALLAGAARDAPASASLHAAAAKTALQQPAVDAGLADAALAHAERAFALAFDLPRVAGVLGEACLAAGQPDRAAALAEKLLRRGSSDQALVALQAMAWRMLGDPRYRELCDYDKVVGSWVIDTPRGWPNLAAYLADLGVFLKACHDVPLDAFGMVRRDGVETRNNLTAADGEPIRAFYEALEAPVREYVTRLGRGRDPLRRRNQGGARVMAGWSVKTLPGGSHGAHLHSEGWLSSAFYVELPPAVDGGGREGWIKFGEPAIPTRPRLEAEHHVKPDPGRFVLFPSYMWHGTEPFSGEGVRLVMSVDFSPARP
ncbi:MAG TPA: putative 2OG-Fe(II) oxygenase [Caulobacteraceae bacterium]|jgi:tetratricopeptide (TPR) repeat protein|nr:putative 2OG-Fe(II) oxygenase [Caulobacteraceae bacterium]